MPNYSSNYKLILKIKGISDRIEQIKDEAGEMLARNVRVEARKRFKGSDSIYPYEFQNSFQKDSVVYYDKSKRAVFVDHPAAKRLEYGLGKKPLVIEKPYLMRFKGKDGEEVYTNRVEISNSTPLYYARAAIEDTLKDVRKRFKEVIE